MLILEWVLDLGLGQAELNWTGPIWGLSFGITEYNLLFSKVKRVSKVSDCANLCRTSRGSLSAFARTTLLKLFLCSSIVHLPTFSTAFCLLTPCYSIPWYFFAFLFLFPILFICYGNLIHSRRGDHTLFIVCLCRRRCRINIFCILLVIL